MDAAKSRAEREAEEAERQRRRVAEALGGAEAALTAACESIRFAHGVLREKSLDASLEESADRCKLLLLDLSVSVELARDTAVVKVVFQETRPRDFDFAKDRHISAADVEEYVGRRCVELVRLAQKANPW